MNEMEEDYIGQIVEWSFANYMGVEDITTEQLVNEFWAPLLPCEDYSIQSDGDSKPIDDLIFYDGSQPL